LIAPSPYRSQFGQDAFLDRLVFHGFRDGYFVDVGAHDGESCSNSVFFERERGWRGLCIEPNAAVFERLSRARTAECICCCIAAMPGEAAFLQVTGPSEMLSGMAASYDEEHRRRLEAEAAADGSTYRTITVPAMPLARLLGERHVAEIHFLGIDTEGGEAEILRSFDFAQVFVHAIAVEENYREGGVAGFLGGHGLVPLLRLAVDTVYLNRGSPFFTRALVLRCLTLRAAARIERKLRRFGFLSPGPARFPYKAPR
jgi:FkbM family methyltransferase